MAPLQGGRMVIAFYPGLKPFFLRVETLGYDPVTPSGFGFVGCRPRRGLIPCIALLPIAPLRCSMGYYLSPTPWAAGEDKAKTGDREGRPYIESEKCKEFETMHEV